jgi:phosphoglycolate phosphatase-like HAD superfamily hydrolase
VKRYGFYIFDLDNTLVDSRKGYEEAFMTGFREFGIPYDPALYHEYIRTPLELIFAEYYPNSPCMYRDFFSLIITTYERTCLNGVGLFPDAERCLDRLAAEGCGLGIVSNSFTAQICQILERLGIDDMFSSVVGFDRVAMPKPDPEPVLLCIKEMGSPPDDTIFIGDSDDDIIAGKRAGLFSVMISRRGNAAPFEECDLCIESMDEL